MSQLPDEIWVQICDFLDPTDLLKVQRISRRLLKLGRDPSLWKGKCFEKAPSAVHAFANGSDLSNLLNGLSLTPPTTEGQPNNGDRVTLRTSRRARAIAKWDCTNAGEKIDWYSEYIARHAPLSTEWQRHSEGNEIRSMALFNDEQRVLSAMEDGSLRIWDVKTSRNGRRTLCKSAASKPELLFTHLISKSSGSTSSMHPTVGAAIDSTVVHHDGKKAFVAVEDMLNEIDLGTMDVISRQKWAWKITAISQQSDTDLPLMVGTSFSLNMHDPRIRLRYQDNNTSEKFDHDNQDKNTVFLPNYAKDWPVTLPRTRGPPQRSHNFMQNVLNQANSSANARRGLFTTSGLIRPARPELYAHVEPGPQAILHRGANEIVVAGRMPSILFYDKRTFPQLQSVIHSGARLSSLSLFNQPPYGATSSTAECTLLAVGEYHGRGSLERYELPHTRTSDRKASYDWPQEEVSSAQPSASSPSSSNEDLPDQPATNTEAPYSHRNRQSSSSAKLLSVVPHGARILYSDSEGYLKWVERDGRGVARRWNINADSYNYSPITGVGAMVGDSVARKLLTFSSEAFTESRMTRGDGDVLAWTGSEIGIVTSKVKWTGHDELVAAFEEQMSLEESERRRSAEEERGREEEYSRVMRRALERQADERRFLARFGRMGGW